jgi:hypothetical protein
LLQSKIMKQNINGWKYNWKQTLREVGVKVTYQTDQMSIGCQAVSVHLLAAQ